MIKKLTLCDYCAEELRGAGYRLESTDGGKVKSGTCDLCGGRRPAREHTARKGAEADGRGKA